MRIYNGKNSQIDLPIGGNVRLTIPGKSISKDFMPSESFLNLIATTFEEKEIALIVGGPFEINMCSRFPSVAPMIVQSTDEAIKRFTEVKPTPVVEEPVIEPEPVKEEVTEEPKPQVEVEEKEEVIEEPAPVVVEEKEEVAVEETPAASVQTQPKPKKKKKK